MKTRFIHLLLLLAAFLAAGSQWDFVQVFAWGRMFARTAHTLSARAANSETFNPAKRCALCRAVSSARDSQEGRAGPTVTKYQKEILLAFAPRSLFIARPFASHTLRPLDWAVPAGDKAAPLVPPPRACA